MSQGSTGSSTFAGDAGGLVTVSAGTLTVDGASASTTSVRDRRRGRGGCGSVRTGTRWSIPVADVNAGDTLTSPVRAGSLGGGGSVTVNGVIDGALDVENTSTFDINAGGSVTGTATHASTGTSTLAGTVGNLNITAAGTVQVDGAAVSNGLSFVDGGGTLAVQAGASYTATGGPVNVGFDAGNTGSGTLSVADTGSVIGNIFVHNAGTVDINGTSGDATTEVTGALVLFATATGNSTVAGDIGGAVTVNAGTLTVDGVSEFQSSLDVNAGSLVVSADLGVTGAAEASGGDVTVDAGATLTTATLTMSGDGALTLNGDLDGDLNITDTNNTVAVTHALNTPGGVTGTVTQNNANSTITTGDAGNTQFGTLVNTLGTVTVNTGTLQLNNASSNAGTMNVNSGTAVILNTADFTNTGTFDLNGQMGNVSLADTFTNDGGVVTLANNLAAQYVQTGAGAQTTIDGNTLVGTGTTGATMAINAGALTIDAGQTLTYGALTLADGATMTVNGSMAALTDTTTNINGAATYNDGSALNDNGSINIGATGSVTFNTGGTGIVFDADQDNNAVGTITSDGAITVNGTGNVSFGTDGDDNFTNQGSATVALLNTSSVSDIDVLTNSSTANGATAGTTAIFLASGTSLGFTTLDSSAGTIVSAGTLDGDVNLTGTAGLDLNDGTITGTLDNQSGTAITLDGTITGAFTQQGAGTQTTVDGTSSFGSTVDVDSGTLTVDADTTVTGATTVDDATLTVNAGDTLTATGNVLAGGSGGAGTVVVDGTIDGDVTAQNTATVTVNGSVDGNLQTQNTASFDINGTSGAAPAEVTGNVTQAGTSALNTLAGDIAGFLQQTGAGTITVDGDAIVTGLVNIDAGTLTVAGGATLDATGAGVDVAAGAFGNVNATGEIDGSTTNAGTFQNDGTMDGVTNSGGFTNTGTTAGVTNSGTFTNNGGTGTVGNSGTFDNNGSTLAFSNTGTLTTSGTITGDLDQTAGSTTADGNATVTGELDIDGGTLTVDPGIVLSAGSADIEDAGGVTVGAGSTLQTTTGTLANDDQIAVGAGGNLIAATTLTNESNGTITFANGGTLSAGGAGQGTITNEGQIVVNAGTVTATGNDNFVASGMGTGLQILGGHLDLGTGTVTDTGTGTLTAVTLTADASGGAMLTTGGVTFDEAEIELNANASGDATVTGPVTVGGTGFFDLNSAGGSTATITGDVIQQAGSTATSTLAGTLGGILDINGGTVTVDGTGGGGTSVVTGALTVDGGTLNVNANTDAAAGTTVGATGTVSNTATFATNVTNAGGFTNDGTVSGGVGNSGTLDNNGTVTGNVTNTGTLTDSGSIGGSLTQTAGSTTVDGNATVTGLFDMNGGTLAIDPGFTFAVGSADIEDAGGVTLGAGSTLQTTSGALDNDDQVAIGNGGTLLSFAALSNETNGVMDFLGATGALTAGAGSDITNTGRFNINSAVGQTVTLTTSGAGTFTNTGLIDMVDGETADRLVINGDAVLNGIIGMDVNVSGALVGTSPADTADQVNVTGTASGAPTLAFSNVNGVFSNVAVPIDLITAANTGGVSATQTGLPTNGAFIYNLQNTGTAVQLTATPNLAFGGVASGVAATQSLISTVVNRPSSALVTPLVAPGDDPCAIGSWSRITGGKASAGLSTSAASLPGSLSNQIDLRYRGIQVGLDRSCSGGYYNGWDLAYGAMLGTNGGDTSLPVNFGGTVTTLSTEFDQTFGGFYLSAAKGQWFGDLSIRADKTTYSIQESNSFANGGLGINTQDFDSRGKTVSGSLSYSHTLNEQLGLRLVPTAGFSFSHIESDSIAIENDPSTAADNATLQIGDIDQRIGYLGATLARTQVAESGTAATTYFVTGTYFNDFGDDLESTFTVDSNGSSQVLTSETLGGFGELSFGFNYTAILDAGSAVPARQVDASLRADTRFSDNLDSWGLTAQVRLQF
ncbi:beta strand repeat-containing protein [Sagittula stellata]|uniref:Outer membrane autotransporter barrel n=1 Tax=Sagittula stellata (strain ATCC 700073 / DSM 11524 / E-37) TaxID=388399 RepID=A3K1J1_SAGS3|nr:hypothetical protein [Sagittula stellata]EBA08787.1 outer membrane autotransporter barrel [Sagittula stellata E-37]